MLRTKKLSEKIMVLGVDGLDPRFTKRLLDQGKMPNFKKLIERGAAREDLMLLGGCAPVTPPGWATLSTGAYSYTHGICQFSPYDPVHNKQGYNLNSKTCKAEQAWNCFAEAGKKTFVLHWPGGAWPPTSDSENLYVLDGSVPSAPGSSGCLCDGGIFFGANPEQEIVEYIPLQNADIATPCIVKDAPIEDPDLAAFRAALAAGAGSLGDGWNDPYIIMDLTEGFGIRNGRYNQDYNFGKSYLRPAQGWANAPADALEFAVLLHNSMIRRHGLVLKNGEGKYDRIAIYKSKKDVEPMAVIKDKEFYRNFIDEGYKGDNKVTCARDIYVQEIDPEGKNLRMYFCIAMRTDSDTLFHPKSLHKELMENVGPLASGEQFYSQNREQQLIQVLSWEHVKDWFVKCIDYMVEKEGIEVIFSHFHGVDLMVHTIIRYLKDQGYNKETEDQIEEWMARIYDQTDRYIGEMMHYLDEGWTIIVTSDHGLVCPANEPPALGDMCGINIGLMEELGYTVMQYDENGKKTRKIDWTKTRAIADQGGNIWINLKGRSEVGIVEPEDKYELEEQIMTDLYGYRQHQTGKRAIALALRNKDAILIGIGGPTAGDIITANADGYNFDHTDGLMTGHGERGTSLSPIFIAAGAGVKEGFTIDRMIRQVDVAPTMCALAGVRFPAQCEGAPIYPLFTEEV